MKRAPLIVAGIIFTIVALVHLLRILYHWKIIIGAYHAPVLVSIVGLIVTAILAIWMFYSAARD